MLPRGKERGREGSPQPKPKERESQRETPPARAAGSPTSPRSWKKLLPSIGVGNTSSQHRGREQGGWGSVGRPEPNPAGLAIAQPGPPAPPSPEPHEP